MENKGNTGVTLIALVITIIVLLILAGISIMLLGGKNGVLTNAKNAKEQAIIGQEKDIISLAWNSLMTDKYTKGEEITNTNFQDELNNNGNNTNVRYEDDDENKNFLVNFKDTNNEYIVYRNGNVIWKGTNIIDDSPTVFLSSIKSWTSSSNTDFHKESIRNSIAEIEFVDYLPNPVVLNDDSSWDISQEENQSVIAWLENIDNSEYKKLYIGGKGGVKANTDSSYVFSKFSNLVSINFGKNYDTREATTMQYMFSDCGNLKRLDLSKFDTKNVVDMTSMFNMPNDLTSKLENITFGSKWNTSKVTSMAYMFCECANLGSLNLTNFNTSSVTSMRSMFNKCNKLTALDVSGFDTGNVTNMYAMFFECDNLTSLNLSNFDTKNVTNMKSMFNMSNDMVSKLQTIIFGSKWNTSNVTDLSYIFSECVSLSSIDLSSFHTDSATTMSFMFSNCTNLATLDLSSFNTMNVTDMSDMFYNCGNLTEINLCSFNTSNVTNMHGMFDMPDDNTSKLKTIYASSNFDTTKVTDSIFMFSNCVELIGGNGTVFDGYNTHKEYARIDTYEQKGYFTERTN